MIAAYLILAASLILFSVAGAIEKILNLFIW